MIKEICPYCKTAINGGAEVCHGCGAFKGYGRNGMSKNEPLPYAVGMTAFGGLGLTSQDELIMWIGGIILAFGVMTFCAWLYYSNQKPLWFRKR